MTPIYTWITPDNIKIDFTLSVTLEHQRSLVHQRVDLKGSFLANRCELAHKPKHQWLSLTYKQVVDTTELGICTHGLQDISA